MADIKDILSSSGTKNTVSLVYLLLMANVLGLAVFMDNRNNKVSVSQASEQKVKANQVIQSDKEIVAEHETKSELSNLTIDNKEKPENKANVINFKEAVAFKTKDSKLRLKPLIWNFPQK